MADDHQGSVCSVGSHESDERSRVRSNVSEQDIFLPIAKISRHMKKVIPASGKISKDAKEAMQKCVSEFITFVNGEASDKCRREKRKVLNGDDVIWAMAILGFEDYVEPLKAYLCRFREIEDLKATDVSTQTVGMQPYPYTSQPGTTSTNLLHQSSFSQGINHGITMEADMNGSTKAVNGSVITERMQPSPTSQLAPQGSFSQGMTSHGISQGDIKGSAKATNVSIKIEGMQPSPTAQGDTKGSTKYPDVSVKIEGMQPSPASQHAHQGIFSQGTSYGVSQVDIKGSAKATDVSVKIEGMPSGPPHSVHIKVNYSQGMSYGISQVKRENEGVSP